MNKNDFVSLTGKSMSEDLIFALTNPQYYKILFMKIANCKLRTSGEHVVYINCFLFIFLTFRTIFVHNMFSSCCELLEKIYLYLPNKEFYRMTFNNLFFRSNNQSWYYESSLFHKNNFIDCHAILIFFVIFSKEFILSE